MVAFTFFFSFSSRLSVGQYKPLTKKREYKPLRKKRVKMKMDKEMIDKW